MRQRIGETRARRVSRAGAMVAMLVMPAALLLAGCTPARFAQPGPVVEPSYRQADVRPGYYVDMGGGTGVPLQLFVYTGAPAP